MANDTKLNKVSVSSHMPPTIIVDGVEKQSSELTLEDYNYLEVEYENSKLGTLNLADGINCDKCNNRGYFLRIPEDDKTSNYVVDCDCKKQRLTIQRLKDCGITQSMLTEYTFSNYKCDYEWQNGLKGVCLSYCNEIKDGRRYSFALFGQSGCGKTHLCTAIFQKLIRSNMSGYYMLWNREIPNLIALEKSSSIDNQEKYFAALKKYSSCDVLYIDDFLKLTINRYSDDSLSMAYKIINDRYLMNKITIISSEFLPEQLAKMDMAIFGRITEMAKNGHYIITCSNDINKNYRLKGNN